MPSGSHPKDAPQSKTPHVSPDYYREIVQGLPSGVVALDAAGRVMAANSAAAELLRISQEALDAGSFFFQLPVTAPFLPLIETLWRNRLPLTRREVTIGSGGEARVFGVTASLVGHKPGTSGAALLFTDLTEVRRLERVAGLNRQLAQIGELTAGVVHELRNPISVISGMAELLIRRSEPASASYSTGASIAAETAQLDRLIRNFLSFAKPFELEPGRCSVEEVVDRALQLCRGHAQEHGVTVETEISESLPALMVDETRMAQALGNLIQNGIEASPAGGRVWLRCTHSDSGGILFQVLDEGRGVNCDSGQDIFTPFYSRKEGGTGLGLAIVQRIVSAHNGVVRYANRSCGGACFEVQLPRAGRNDTEAP